jgi:alcohol dehydrogenase class IV
MISGKIFTIHYRDVPSNPPIEFAESLVERAREATKVISIGGGSTIDVGKYVSFPES